MAEAEPEEAAVRLDSPLLGGAVSVLAVALTAGSVAWALDLFRMAGLTLYTEQFLAGMLAVALPLTFLAVPAGKGRFRDGGVPWYDLVCAVAGFLACANAAWRYPTMAEEIISRPLDGLIPGAIMVVLLIEGLRRTVGRVLTVVVVGFLLLALIGDQLPGSLQGRPVGLGQITFYMGWDASAVLGIPMQIVTTIVVAFVLFGRLLFKSGGSTFFTDIAMVLMGRTRGGPAKISVFASSLFGSISGSVVSNVVTTGIITIPMMKRGGYQPHLAGAIEAVASTGGQLMPPVMGAAAFLMAEFLSVSYTDVVVAALIPAVLYYVGLFVGADLEAAKGGIARVPESEIPSAIKVLREGWFFPLPFVVLIGALFWLNYSPELSALLGVAVVVLAAMVIGYRGRRLTVLELYAAIRSTGLGVLDIFMIGAAAGMVIGALNISGIGFGLTLGLVQLAGHNLAVLLVLSAGVCVLLGMGMPTVGVYVLLATLVAPALVEVGIRPMAAHMFIMYFGMMSMITPPVCIGAFAAATLSGSDPMRTGFAAMRFGWVAFVIPFMFVASPTLLMEGSPAAILVDLAAAIAGTWLASAGMVGHFGRKLSAAMRILFIVSGFALVVPASGFGYGFGGIVNLLGLALGAALLIVEIGRDRIGMARRTTTPTSSEP